jgi:tripartite-type tricarboxylate transporter receptor subunit TctC
LFEHDLFRKPLHTPDQVRGRLFRDHALGIASKERSAVLPDLPTVAEAGEMPGFEAESWYALMAPAQPPDPVIRKLNAGVVRVLNLPEVKTALASQGAKPVGNAPGELAAVIAADTARWAKVIKDAKIELRP